MFSKRKSSVPDISDASLQGSGGTTWKLNIGFALIVVLSISAVGLASFGMISDSMLSHAKASSAELIKQTCRNLETILNSFDEIAMTLSRDDTIALGVSQHDDMEDIHAKAANARGIQEILNNRVKMREDIIEIAVITNQGDYISSGVLGPNVAQDIFSSYVAGSYVKSQRGSLWLGTYTTDINSTRMYSENGQVFSLMKGIYASGSLKSKGMLLINISESYLYNIVSDINPTDDGRIFIVGSDGSYVLNPQDRNKNAKKAEYEFINQVVGGEGKEIRKVDNKEYLITFQTINEIKGTELGWTIIEMTPVSSITSSVVKAGKRLFFIGLACVAVGFVLTGFITRLYNIFLDKSYSERHAIVLERERLASLGQLIGGIAHNFKTPIMSIAGGLEGIKDLVEEYRCSIGDDEVTPEDHREIASEMKEWIDKIKPYCSYMSEIISTVKGHTVSVNESSNLGFSIKELLKRVEILMEHELKMHQCRMKMHLELDTKTLIGGEINNLVQVINNLISNAIEAYNNGGGIIDIFMVKKGQNIEIRVKDYGMGIPDKVKKKLFKEMITTKGKNGTGLGLYMSYSTIKGKFGGSMWIESEEGKGSEVCISIPGSIKR